MANPNSLEALFAKGVTVEQFISKHKELSETVSSSSDASSIFKVDASLSLEQIFKTVDVDSDGVLSQSEIANLSKFDETDGKNKLTENDLRVLYKKTSERMEATIGKGTPAEKYDRAVNGNSLQSETKEGETSTDTYMRLLGTQIQTLNELIAMRENEGMIRIQAIQKELDNLIIMDSDLTDEEKQMYIKNSSDIQTVTAQQVQKQKEIKEKQEEMELLRAEIEYTKAHPDADQSQLQRLQNSYNDLASEVSALQSEIGTQNGKLDKINTSQNRFLSRAKIKKSSVAGKKANLLQRKEFETTSLKQDVERYRAQISELEAAQNYAISQAATVEYSDSDTTQFTGSAQDLKAKWGRVAPHLTDGFYSKVIALSERVGCDADALMAVMYSESGLKPTAVNKSSGATGLIQFMPKTAPSHGTTVGALRNMSAEQQLVYVEKYLNANKKMAGFGANEKVNQGQLYALIFLPAYAKRNVLTAKGHKFYNSNTGLDVNKDGQITISDLSARVEQMKNRAIGKRK